MKVVNADGFACDLDDILYIRFVDSPTGEVYKRYVVCFASGEVVELYSDTGYRQGQRLMELYLERQKED